MFGALKKLFSKPPGHEMPDGSLVFTPDGNPPNTADPLAQAVSRSAPTAEFIRILSEQGLHVIGKNLREESGDTQFDFVDAPGEFWVFSSSQRASEFVQTIPITCVTPYSVLGLSADFLLTNDFTRVRLILNPKSKFEREITRGDIDELRRHRAPSKL